MRASARFGLHEQVTCGTSVAEEEGQANLRRREMPRDVPHEDTLVFKAYLALKDGMWEKRKVWPGYRTKV